MKKDTKFLICMVLIFLIFLFIRKNETVEGLEDDKNIFQKTLDAILGFFQKIPKAILPSKDESDIQSEDKKKDVGVMRSRKQNSNDEKCNNFFNDCINNEDCRKIIKTLNFLKEDMNNRDFNYKYYEGDDFKKLNLKKDSNYFESWWIDKKHPTEILDLKSIEIDKIPSSDLFDQSFKDKIQQAENNKKEWNESCESNKRCKLLIDSGYKKIKSTDSNPSCTHILRECKDNDDKKWHCKGCSCKDRSKEQIKCNELKKCIDDKEDWYCNNCDCKNPKDEIKCTQCFNLPGQPIHYEHCQKMEKREKCLREGAKTCTWSEEIPSRDGICLSNPVLNNEDDKLFCAQFLNNEDCKGDRDGVSICLWSNIIPSTQGSCMVDTLKIEEGLAEKKENIYCSQHITEDECNAEKVKNICKWIIS